MAYASRSTHAGDVAPAGHAHGPGISPGRRSAAGELFPNGVAPAGKAGPDHGGDSQSLFAGPVQWEDIDDIHDEDPLALAEAQQPAEDEDADAGPADEEGELDADSEGEEAEAVDDPHASAAPAGEPGNAPAAAAPYAPTGSAQTSASGDRAGGDQRKSRAPASAKAASAGKTYHVNRSYRDGPYGGTAKYDVRVTGKAITVSVGIRLKPGRGVTSSQVKHVKSTSQAIFKRKYDARFKLTEIPYKPRPLRMQLRFSHPNPHHDVALHKGGGRDNAANWYVKGDTTTRAHEIGHLLGLKDEYADDASPKRKVYTDNSLMGNYYNEGIKTASLKKRHGKVFAGDISSASGRRFYISS